MIKFYKLPLVLNLLYYKLLSLFPHIKGYTVSSKNILRSIYLDLNLWYFFKNLYFVNRGNLSSNFNISVVYWTLNNSYHNLPKVSYYSTTYFRPKPIANYIKEIRILLTSLNKKTFNRITLLIVLLLLKPFSTFLNYINISYSFLLLCKGSNFFIFYNAFYFKVFNY